MKNLLLAALAVTIGFASCSKEPGGGNQKETKAIVKVYYGNSGYQGRGALDDITDAVKHGAVTVKDNLYILLFNGTQMMLAESVAIGSGTTSASFGKDKLGNDLTTGIDKVLVLGNLPTGVTLAQLQSQDTFAGVQALLRKTLAEAQSDYLLSGGAHKVWVQGEATPVWAQQPDVNGVTQGTASVSTFAPVLTRIDVTVNLAGVTDGIFTSVPELVAKRAAEPNDDDKLKGGVVIEGVAILYSSAKSTLALPFTSSDGVPEGPGNVLASGITAASRAGLWLEENTGRATLFGGQSFLNAGWTDASWTAANPNTGSAEANYIELKGNDGPNAVNKGTFTRSFFAFSPDNYATSTGMNHFISDLSGYKAVTMVTVYGKWYDHQGLNPKNTYWTLHFNPSSETGIANLELLKPGKRYGVTLNFSKDMTGGGSQNPEEPVELSSNLTITVKPAQWKAFVEIEKNFVGED